MSRKNKSSSKAIATASNTAMSEEEKLMRDLEGASDSSAQIRTVALQNICELLIHRFVPSMVKKHKESLIRCIEKSLKRGKGAEQILGVKLAGLLALQLGPEAESTSEMLDRYLLTTIQDKTVCVDVRAKCCNSLALMCLVGSDNRSRITTTMQLFEDIFSLSYSPANKMTTTSGSAEASHLQSEALSAWALLLTLTPVNGVFTRFITSSFVTDLISLLQSPYLEMRMTAGETLALIWECGRSNDADFLPEVADDLIDAVKQLATDSQRFRSKRDRKSQKASFRDVLQYLEDDISPQVRILFGTEELLLDSWIKNCQYSALCTLMGSGLTNHLQENLFIRQIFKLERIIGVNSAAKTFGPHTVEQFCKNKVMSRRKLAERCGNIVDKRSSGEKGTQKNQLVACGKSLESHSVPKQSLQEGKVADEFWESFVTPQRRNCQNTDKRTATEKSLRHGKGAELLWETKISSLLDVLLNGDKNARKKLMQVFGKTVFDWPQTLEVRAKSCHALSLLYLRSGNDTDSLLKTMSSLYLLCDGSCHMGYSREAGIGQLYASALSAWGLLLTLLPACEVVSVMTKIRHNRWHSDLNGKDFIRLLKADFLEVRVVATETVALALECGRPHDKKFLAEYIDDYIIAVRQLENDLQSSALSAAKGDLKIRRTVCREVLKYLEHNNSPEISVGTESVVLNSWASYCQYSALNVEIGSEFASFLQKEKLLPNDIKMDVISRLTNAKQSKLKLNLMNASAFKQRSLIRGENRNKRFALVT